MIPMGPFSVRGGFDGVVFVGVVFDGVVFDGVVFDGVVFDGHTRGYAPTVCTHPFHCSAFSVGSPQPYFTASIRMAMATVQERTALPSGAHPRP